MLLSTLVPLSLPTPDPAGSNTLGLLISSNTLKVMGELLSAGLPAPSCFSGSSPCPATTPPPAVSWPARITFWNSLSCSMFCSLLHHLEPTGFLGPSPRAPSFTSSLPTHSLGLSLAATSSRKPSLTPLPSSPRIGYVLLCPRRPLRFDFMDCMPLSSLRTENRLRIKT